MRLRSGFTLIELLVVVAIISLLIAILIPSLSQARKQARTTLGQARLALLTKAMGLYAEDNGDLPPFIGRGWEDLDDPGEEEWPRGSGTTVADLRRSETWCVNRPETTWFLPQENWPDDVGVERGSLFTYTRFRDIYACPEFQRVPNGQKAHGEFNFTRTILGRKWYIKGHDPEADPYASTFGAPGPIMKISEIHSPAKMWMMMDEWYLRHCASPENEFVNHGRSFISGGWMGNDCMNFYLGDEIGRYHGPRVKGLSSGGEPEAVLMGSVGHYDGHIELYRDILPGRTIDFSVGFQAIDLLVDFLIDHLFAQRGLTIDIPGLRDMGAGRQ